MIVKSGILLGTLFLISLLLTNLYRKYALKKSILDHPNHRSSHKQPTPRGGGLVFVGIFMIAAFFLWVTNEIDNRLFYALLGALPVAMVGCVDDFYSVNNKYRIAVHFAAAIWCCAFLGYIHNPMAILVILITVWFINLYNFMDGIDGLAASEAVFVSAISGSVLVLHGMHGIGVLSLILCFSVLGFLVYNWEPAKLFMGDVGSGFLGYVFAVLMWKTASAGVLPVMFWWILLGVFLIDATFTLLYRIKNKEKWYLAHRKHVYQRLVQKGWTHRRVTQVAMLINILILLPIAMLFMETKRLPVELVYVAGSASALGLAWLIVHKYYSVDR